MAISLLDNLHRIVFSVGLIFATFISTYPILRLQKSEAAQIYTYNYNYFNSHQNIYHDPTLEITENNCLNGLLNRKPQTGDKQTIAACLKTFGHNPETKITSPIIIIFETGETSQKVTTTLIYQRKNGQIYRESFNAVGAKYYEWHPPPGIYTLDYIHRDNSASFRPAYGNFYSPQNQKDKNGNPINFGFHGRVGNLMAGNGSNGCYRHQVADMKRIITIINNAGKEQNLPTNWFEKTLPIVVINNSMPVSYK